MFDSAILHVLLDDNFLSLIITAWSDNAARIGVWSSARVNTGVNIRADAWVNVRVDVWVRIRDRARGCTRVYISFSARVNVRIKMNWCIACFCPVVIRLQFNGWETANGAEVFVWVVYKRHAGEKKRYMISNWSLDS